MIYIYIYQPSLTIDLWKPPWWLFLLSLENHRDIAITLRTSRMGSLDHWSLFCHWMMGNFTGNPIDLMVKTSKNPWFPVSFHKHNHQWKWGQEFRPADEWFVVWITTQFSTFKGANTNMQQHKDLYYMVNVFQLGCASSELRMENCGFVWSWPVKSK